MTSGAELDVSYDVAKDLYPVTLRQARAQVAIQALVLLVFALLLLVGGLRRRLAWTVSMLAAGAVATAYDVRWWLWLRRADPIAAYRRNQTRSASERQQRQRLSLAVSVGALMVWLIFGNPNAATEPIYDGELHGFVLRPWKNVAMPVCGHNFGHSRASWRDRALQRVLVTD
jgi:hypothetical protein